MTQPSAARHPPASPTGDVQALARGWLTVAALALAAWLLPHLHPLLLGAAIVVLALPVMAAAWHRGAARKLEGLHRFATESWLRRWAARRVPGQAASAIGAVVLTAAVLLQTPYFGAIEWIVVALAPPVFAAWQRLCLTRALPLYSRRVYAASAASRLARVLTFGTLVVAWLAARSMRADAAAQPLAELAYALQSAWPAPASATVRWALDAGAWAEATRATLEAGAAQAAWWRTALALIVLPLTVFGYAAWAAAGAALPWAELRRIFGATLGDEEAPPALPPRRALAYALPAAAAAALAVTLFWHADVRLAQQERWLALHALPNCERIGGTAYAVGTLAKASAYTRVLDDAMAARRATACSRIAEIERGAAARVDAYLDWYFSIGAEWMRTALLVTGDVDTLLELKFHKLVANDPRLAAQLAELDGDRHFLIAVAQQGDAGLERLLAAQRLVLDERQCKAVASSDSMLPALPRHAGLRTRLAVSGASGVAAGAFAGALTARAMSRASMQAAGRVLGKAAAKTGAGRLSAAGAGVATGAAAGATAGSIVPGLGTAIGALTGLAVGVGVDIALLAMEEKLIRPEMRRDLLAAVDESLQPLRAAFDCSAR